MIIISCVIDCPYDGKVAPSDVAEIAETLFQAGCDEISLGDTIGNGHPDQVDAMLTAVKKRVPACILAGHYHDTAARALDNIDVSLEHGLRTFDASIAGLGGCPYAPGAKGNVGTEKVFDHLLSRDFSILGDPDRAALARVGDMARSIVGKPLNAI